MNIKDYAFVANVGEYSRVICRHKETYYAGCFSGTREEFEADVKDKYRGQAQIDYLKAIDTLANSTLHDFKDIHAALCFGAAEGKLDLVQYLIEKGADIHANNNEALRWAALKGKLDVVMYLVEQGADIHAQNDFPLRFAAVEGKLDVVMYLVEQGANIHANNNEALRYAAAEGKLEVVQYLIEKGADIHAQNDYVLRYAEEN